MKAADVTPFILAYNEEPNIARCLESVKWAAQILVLDSGSTDRTAEIVARYPQARLVVRPFDCHANQGNYGLSLINTRWVLSLDSDYILSDDLQREIQQGEFDPGAIYFAPFIFRVYGRPLRIAFMPPRGILYAHAGAIYDQDGHTQRIRQGSKRVARLRGHLIHDDRKPIARWMESQRKYAVLEADKLLAEPVDGMPIQDRIRRTGWLSPLIMLPYALFARGLILDGWPGIIYAFQRWYAELILALHILDRRFDPGPER